MSAGTVQDIRWSDLFANQNLPVNRATVAGGIEAIILLLREAKEGVESDALVMETVSRIMEAEQALMVVQGAMGKLAVLAIKTGRLEIDPDKKPELDALARLHGVDPEKLFANDDTDPETIILTDR